MASVKFTNASPISKNIESKDFPITKFNNDDVNVKIYEDLPSAKRLKEKSYAISKFTNSNVNVKVNQFLPFRVKFTTIGIEGYGPGNVPPIGIAVIGINNYIL